MMSSKVTWCLALLALLPAFSLQAEDPTIDPQVIPEFDAPANSTTKAPQITTAKPTSKCRSGYYGRLSWYWTSPNYGDSNYPDNCKCSWAASALRYLMVFDLVKFNLQNKVKGKCVDYLKFHLPYGRSKILCGKLKKAHKVTKTVGLPRLEFVTDSKINKPGFNLTFKMVESPCVKRVYAKTVGETDIISTPSFDKPHASNYDCMYTIYAPDGGQVKIDYLTVKTRKSRRCKVDWALINGDGHYHFPPATSRIVCGKRKVTNIPASTKGRMHVAYKGSAKRSRGMQFKYTIIKG